MSQLSEEARVREANNRRGMEDMVIKLRQEEEHSYKLGKKKQRDIDSLQSSLSVRMTLADEIKRLSLENQTMADTLAHYSVEHVLEHCGHAVRSELENFDRVMEGLKKVW